MHSAKFMRDERKLGPVRHSCSDILSYPFESMFYCPPGGPVCLRLFGIWRMYTKHIFTSTYRCDLSEVIASDMVFCSTGQINRTINNISLMAKL